MMFDPLYLVMVGPFFLFALIAAGMVKLTFARYSQMALRSGYTGGQFARELLDRQGLRDVPVEVVPGHLSDHYDPQARVVRLSEAVFYGNSPAAVGVAAHEVGHALQHQNAYAPLMFRNNFYPVAAFGSSAWIWLFVAGIALAGSSLGQLLLSLAIACFGVYVVFALVTLPVEFNASTRALAAIRQSGIMTTEELRGTKSVLTAAAMTYVASAAQAIATLLYLLQRRD